MSHTADLPQAAPAQPARGRAAVVRAEWLRCSVSFPYWLDEHGRIYDAAARTWVRFRLWPAQVQAAQALAAEQLLVVLKARQLGMTWLAVGYALWLMLFRPAATVLLFSRRDDEAVHLLGFRLRGMYRRLPAWMQARAATLENAHELRLSNGSAALAFPTTGGRSYTATLAVVDEADHVEDLDALLDAVKPTVDGGGSLVLCSTANKERSGSPFQRIYRAAAAGENGWRALFLPWSARPDRTAAWYATQRQEISARTGALDSLYQEYPASDVEALAGRTLDRRFAVEWLARAHARPEPAATGCLRPEPVEGRPEAARAPGLPGLALFEAPRPGALYLIGADPAEGNPQSDESAACVVDALSGDQVAVLAGRAEPAVFAARLLALSDAYNGAGVLVERNNHGHAVLLWLAEQGSGCVLRGLDGRPGWLSSGRGKALAFDAAAEALRDGAPRVLDTETLRQLGEVRGATLAAPAGDRDDRAVAWVLAQAAARYSAPPPAAAGVVIAPAPPFDPRETGGW